MSSSAETQYVTQTRSAYQDEAVAQRYRRYHTRGWSWIRLTMWRQARAVEALLRDLLPLDRGLVLDIPCGTGLLGPTFRRLDAHVFGGDVSVEMIKLARPDYDPKRTIGFARQDLTRLPLSDGCAVGIVTLGLFHRLPKEVRAKAILEMARVTRRWMIVSFTEDNFFHMVKRGILRRLYRGYAGAPCPWRLCELISEVEAAGFKVVKQRATVPILSSEVVCLFERCP